MPQSVKNQQAALAQYQAQLGGQQQGFGQQVTQRQLGNQAIGQNQQAALAQQQAALAAQNQQFNQLLQSGQFGNTAQQQSLQQQLALRNQPLNEITGLMGGSQIQMPQFQGYQGSNDRLRLRSLLEHRQRDKRQWISTGFSPLT